MSLPKCPQHSIPSPPPPGHHIPVHLPDSVSPLHERRPAPAFHSQTGAQAASPLRGPTRRRAGQNHPDSERTHLLSPISFDFLTNCPSLPCGHLPPHSQPAQAWGRFPSWPFRLVPGPGPRVNGALCARRPAQAWGRARPSALSSPRRPSPACPPRPGPPPLLTSGSSRPGTVGRPMSGQLWPLNPPSGLGQWRPATVAATQSSRLPSGARASGRGVEG